MKILITTGIFPPNSGGPATYAPKLAQGLVEAGHQVKVITLSDESVVSEDSRYSFEVVRIHDRSKISNYLRFFWVLLRETPHFDVVYTFSFFSYGFLTSITSRLFRKPYLVRLGGDYLWEQFYLSSNPPITLRDFYEQGLYKKYPIGYYLVRSILRNATKIVFNSEVQRDMYKQAYSLKNESTTVVYNPISSTEFSAQRTTANKEIVYAGRITPMKNVETLVRSFGDIRPPGYKLVIIGDGPRKNAVSKLTEKLNLGEQVEFLNPLPQSELFERIVNARLVVLTSWTDISPNLIFECKSLDIPFLVTEENYLPFRDEIPNMIDPRSSDDVARKMNLLVRDEDVYQIHQEKINEIHFSWSWHDIVSSHIKLLTQSL